jgi:hypothetical protein
LQTQLGNAVACDANGFCSNGTCAQCPGTKLACEDPATGQYSCVDSAGDAANCGACGNDCGPGYLCCGGQCVAQDNETCYTCSAGDCGSEEDCCPGTTTGESGHCANLDREVGNTDCGACGNDCSNRIGQICCADACLTRDESNCAACGDVCDAGETCCSQAISGSQVKVCADLQSNQLHCGECDNTCGYAGTSRCCDGVCTDIRTDPANCGGCGVVCPGGEVCCRFSSENVCTPTGECANPVN